jgi:iron complex outermembrane recepter protein
MAEKIKSLYSKAALLMMSCFTFTTLVAQQPSERTIRGKLMDAVTELPITGAQFFVDGTLMGTTDEAGKFYFQSDHGVCKATIQHVNYTSSYTFGEVYQERYVIYLLPITHHLGYSYVEGMGTKDKQLNAIGSVAVLDNSDLDTGDGASLRRGLEQVPGVSYEERGNGGSRRINIRGSSYRSPFAVRNIKLYLDGIPLTSPDGSSPIELIEIGDMATAEVIKGPSGSLYGSGNGGVLLFSPKRSERDSLGGYVGQKTTLGSYGYVKSTLYGGHRGPKTSIRASVVRQQTDGFRAQEANDKTQISVFGQFTPGDRLNYKIVAMHYEGNWELPGGLKQAQWDEDPTQAVEFSENVNASVSRKRGLFGAVQQAKLGDHLSNETSVYLHWTKKINPYGTTPFFNGYKDESAEGFGARSVFRWEYTVNEKLDIVASFGGEYQNDLWQIRESEIADFEKGDTKYFNDTHNLASLAFAQVQMEYLPWGTRLEIGASAGQTEFLNTGWSYGDETIPLDVDIRTGFLFLPRVGLSKSVGSNMLVHASWSKGNSTPTLFDMVNVETGAFDLNLTPENGTNTELGVRGTWWDGRLYGDISAYRLDITQAIVPKDEISFHNVGALRQHGFEALVQITPWQRTQGFLRALSYTGGYSNRDFRFVDYTTEGENFKDKLVPGVFLNSATQMITLDLASKIQVRLSHYWYDKSPLNDDNSDWSAAYQLLHFSASYQLSIKKLDFTLFGGVNNLTDTSYSSFMMLNAFGGKYYNPAPNRHFHGGLKLNVNF